MAVKVFGYDDRVAESSSRIYRCILKDEDGTVIAASAMSSITLTLWAKDAASVINSRSGVSVLNANGGSFSGSSGIFQMTFSAADMALSGTGGDEVHYAQFIFTLSNDATERHLVSFTVVDLEDTP